MALSLQKARGVLALVGTVVDNIAVDALNSSVFVKSAVPPQKTPPYHVTVVTKEELRSLSADQIANARADDRHHIFSAGIGGNPSLEVFFVVIIWAAGQQIRKQLGLPSKQFHITLSVHDDHDMDKSIGSLLPDQFPRNPGVDFLDHLTFTLHASGQSQEAQLYASKLVLLFPESHRGFLRLADAALWSGLHKIAMLSYAQAYERAGSEEKVKTYSIKKLIQCSQKTEWGSVFQEHEISQLPTEIRDLLLAPWSLELKHVLGNSNVTPSLRLEPRESLFIPGRSRSSTDLVAGFYKLPRFFRWLIPYHIAIMSTPRDEDDISALASPHLGIRRVLTLTEETPLPQSWFRLKEITNTYLPIPNFHPPSIEQMDIIMRLFEDEDKLPMLIHCGGGKGRAGTVAACYLAACGFSKPHPQQTHPMLSAAEAVTLLRAMRPGSIETSRQEDFVSKWCSIIWKRQSLYPDLPSEPLSCPLEIEGKLSNDAHDLFMLVGLPGSGKSWFAKSVLSRDPGIYISQDDSGSRKVCEAAIGRAGTAAHGSRRSRVFLDRCNTSAEDRKLWLDLASNWCTSPVCVWFDYDPELCTSRAQMRVGHPTLPPGKRVINAIDQMDKLFVRPTLEEGFKAVVIVRSFAAAQELVLRLSPPPSLFKFPRTPHLIDLGAATEDDIVAETSALTLQSNVVITEKIDGANTGFCLSSDRSQIVAQNRSHYVNSLTHEQFKKLDLWIERHRKDLYQVLARDPFFAERYILFGEWMVATHSIPYTHLPDRFIAFDFYDRATKTWADRKTLASLLSSTSIHLVPLMYEGPMPAVAELTDMIQTKSKFYDGRVEGVYVKIERNSQVVSRGKVVRKDFIAGNDHWTKGNLRINGLSFEEGEGFT